MAECALARCVHERRSFRKELQKWGKNVLFLAGLERVAEELVGREKWRDLMEPMIDIDSKIVSDWEPSELCHFCSAHKSEDKCPADSLATYNGAGGTESDGNLSEDAARSPSPPLDQPLDLSMGSRHGHSGMPLSPNSSLDGGENAPVLKVPQVPSKPGMKKRLEAFGCKRSYTEEELQAALRDIQSGKLGTRRAAVIYGIPRSTLRNKVYKLAHERDLHKANSDHSKDQPSSIDEPVSNGDIENTSVPSASESLRQLLQNRIAEKGVSLLSDPLVPALSQFDYGHLGPLLSQVLANVHDLALAKLRSSCNTSEADSSSAELPEECRLSILPELIRRLAEERFDAERSAANNSTDKKNHLPSPNGLSTNGVSDNASSTTSKSVTTNPHNVILKIPSYKPMKTLSSISDNQLQGSSSTSHSNSGNGLSGKGIGVSLREIIAKSITQRAASNNNNRTKEKNRVADICNGSSDSSNLEEPPPTKKTKSSNSGNENENSQCTSTGKPEKRTRPKRGRYRNYDRDNLAEAVRAVQRGEMSVHRAGSYYGVPHSTLEYKVKERHLLRPRKRDLKNKLNNSHNSTKLNSSHSNSSSASATSLNGSKLASTTAAAQDAESDAKSFSGMAVTFPSHMPLWQNNPFFSLDFSQVSPNHFFASQMMRKLQEDALLHAENSSDGSGNKDSMSLLSSIIRSGLEAHAEAAVAKTATTVAKEASMEVETTSSESSKKE